MMTREEKERAVEILRRRYAEQWGAVAVIEGRLVEYFDGLVSEPELHSGWELLCAVKFLRLLRTYEFDHQKVRRVIRLREGEWCQDSNGFWKHVKGGIAQPGTSGQKVYRWEPFQIFVLSSVFGFKAWFDTGLTTADKQELLPTEKVG